MEPAIAPLLERLGRIPDEFGALRGGIRKAVDIVDKDPEMALARSRKELELLVRDVFLRRCGEAPGTRPLENLVQRLTKDGHLPRRVAAHANSVRELGNVGVHSQELVAEEQVTKADVHVALAQLVLVMDWYFKSASPPAGKAKATPAPPAAPRPGASAPARVLWVDDYPANNEFEVGRLREEGVEVVQVRATAEAMNLLGSGLPFALVISDMGRQEAGRSRPKAGLELIRLMRERGIGVPALVYSSARSAEKNRDAVLAAGASGITSSPVELFEMIARILPLPV
jgi:CheY-like chemotaxis protein